MPIIPVSGRPQKVTPMVKQSIINQASNMARAGTAADRGFVENALIQAKKEKAVNQLAEVSPPSAYTTRQMCKAIAPTGAVQAETQTTKRQMEKGDLRNAISFAAVSHACLEGISPAFIFNSDDVGFELGGGKDNKVYVPTEVKRELTLINQGIKVTEDTQKFRVAHLFNTIAADGSLLHSACKIRDDSFSTMRIFELDKSLTVWFLPLNKSHQDFISILYRSFLIPLVLKKRDFLQASQMQGLREHVVGADPAKLVVKLVTLPPCASVTRSAFTLDGEQYQTKEFRDAA